MNVVVPIPVTQLLQVLTVAVLNLSIRALVKIISRTSNYRQPNLWVRHLGVCAEEAAESVSSWLVERVSRSVDDPDERPGRGADLGDLVGAAVGHPEVRSV